MKKAAEKLLSGSQHIDLMKREIKTIEDLLRHLLQRKNESHHAFTDKNPLLIGTKHCAWKIFNYPNSGVTHLSCELNDSAAKNLGFGRNHLSFHHSSVKRIHEDLEEFLQKLLKKVPDLEHNLSPFFEAAS
jgi:hypothetical protein